MTKNNGRLQIYTPLKKRSTKAQKDKLKLIPVSTEVSS